MRTVCRREELLTRLHCPETCGHLNSLTQAKAWKRVDHRQSSPRSHILRQLVSDSLFDDLRSPDSLTSTLLKLWRTAVFSTTPRCFSQDDFQISFLTTHPPFDKIDRVTLHGLIKGMFGFRTSQCLDDDGDLVVQLRDLTQRGSIFGVLSHGEHFALQPILDCHADVVDGWSRRALIGRVDANGVGQLDRIQGQEMWI